MRNQAWLENLLEEVWDRHFSDIERKDAISIMFGRKARTRLGSISRNKSKKTVDIRLTSLFKDREVPEMVIKATLVHELCHYTHGFHSNYEQRFKHPHAGGVIRKEFEERGLGNLYLAQKKWLNSHWPQIVNKYYPKVKTIQRTRRRRIYRLRLIHS